MKPDLRLVECKSILTKTGGFLQGYTHTLNPYAGCGFGAGGCGVYCYVAESPIGRFARADWGLWVDAKVNAANRLDQELASMKDPSSLRVYMSSATDPYQPAEARLAITRRVLEVLRRRPVGLLVVQTRSPLVERDYDLLVDMPFAWLAMTVETDDDYVRRALTPICPSIERRLLAMRHARERNIKVQASVSPILPHDTHRFAELLGVAADRVVVDTFTGDGTRGRRTARRPLPERYARLGWGDWQSQELGQSLYAALVERIGEERVGWSKEGFNSMPTTASRCQVPTA